jgi:hypothetical protein
MRVGGVVLDDRPDDGRHPAAAGRSVCAMTALRGISPKTVALDGLERAEAIGIK